MRRNRLLLQMLHAHPDADYVESFQSLAAVNLEIRRTGANAERLLRKAALEMDIGNHAAAVAAARHASQLSPKDAEPHFVAGRGLMLMALVRARALPGATAGAAGIPDAPEGVASEPANQLASDAAHEFRAAVRLNPDDQEALEDLAVIESILTSHPQDASFARALRAQMENV